MSEDERKLLAAWDGSISDLKGAVVALRDGGWRVQFDIPQIYMASALALFAEQGSERMLHVEVSVHPSTADVDYETGEVR